MEQQLSERAVRQSCHRTNSAQLRVTCLAGLTNRVEGASLLPTVVLESATQTRFAAPLACNNSPWLN